MTICRGLLMMAIGAAACGGSTDAASARAAAQEMPAAQMPMKPMPMRDMPSAVARAPVGYRVTTLGSLGGTVSSGNSINDLGWIAGTSNLTGDTTVRAALWRQDAPLDLGTLGGPNSGVIWPVKNLLGIVSGIAETADLDPLGEAWSCSAFFPAATGHVCRGFVWQDGFMRKLPTLGGTNGFATGTNDFGQTAGWAENAVHDPTCNSPQVLQFRAVLWGPLPQQIEELKPLGGDSTSAATALNDRGQVVGISGICSNAVGERSARHAVLWDHGEVVNLGSLGGTAWNTPMAMNESGVVVGFANLRGTEPETSFNAHAFVWTAAGGMRDLGTLPGDAISEALGVNEPGQIVGLSCGATCRAVLWEDESITDLNTLATGAHDPLFSAGDIDDFGVIAGETQSASGESAAFEATPIRQ